MESIKSLVITGVITFVSGWAIQFVGPKTRLCYWFPHTFIYTVSLENSQTLNIQTSSITVQNLGRKGTEGVEIIHTARPDHFQIFPSFPFREEISQNGAHIIKIENLGPKETFTIQILSYINPPSLQNIRSKDGPAKPIQIQLQRLWPKWVNLILAGLLFVGTGVAIYWLIKGIMILYKFAGT